MCITNHKYTQPERGREELPSKQVYWACSGVAGHTEAVCVCVCVCVCVARGDSVCVA